MWSLCSLTAPLLSLHQTVGHEVLKFQTGKEKKKKVTVTLDGKKYRIV